MNLCLKNSLISYQVRLFNQVTKMQKINKKISLLIIVSVVLVLLNSNHVISQPTNTNKINGINFEITLLNGTVVTLEKFAGKPVVLEWAASWCTTCEDTQKAMKTLYPLYNDKATFLSVSYGGSGDTIEKFAAMKNSGPYPWDFGLDTTNYAAKAPGGPVPPGSLWVLDSNLNIAKDWRSVILTADEIQKTLNSVLDEKDQVAPVNAGNSNIGLPLDNPLFLIFIGFSIVLVVLVVFIKIKPSSTVKLDNEIKVSHKKTKAQLSELQALITDEKNTTTPSNKVKQPVTKKRPLRRR